MIDHGVKSRFTKIVDIWATDSLSLLADVALLSGGLPSLNGDAKKDSYDDEENKQFNFDTATNCSNKSGYFTAIDENSIQTKVSLNPKFYTSSSVSFNEQKCVELKQPADVYLTSAPSPPTQQTQTETVTANPLRIDNKMYIICNSSMPRNTNIIFDLNTSHRTFVEAGFRNFAENNTNGYVLSIRPVHDLPKAAMSAVMEATQLEINPKAAVGAVVEATPLKINDQLPTQVRNMNPIINQTFISQSTVLSPLKSLSDSIFKNTYNNVDHIPTAPNHTSPIFDPVKVLSTSPLQRSPTKICKFDEECIRNNQRLYLRNSTWKNQIHTRKIFVQSTRLEEERKYKTHRTLISSTKQDFSKDLNLKETYMCSICGRGYSTASNLARHRSEFHSWLDNKIVFRN